MKRAFTIRAVSAVLAVGANTINASAATEGCTHQLYWQNGSLLEMSVCNDRPLRMTYQKPLEGLERHGVKVGSLMFVGSRQPGGRLSGIAWVFKRGCGDIGFIVRGRMEKARIVLKGAAPVRNKSCKVTRTRDLELVFERYSALARRSAPDTQRQASFDPPLCAGRTQPAERTICTSNRLSVLDGRMLNFYKWLYQRLKGFERARLVRNQRNWIATSRNACRSDARCIERSYLDRLSQLAGGLKVGR